MLADEAAEKAAAERARICEQMLADEAAERAAAKRARIREQMLADEAADERIRHQEWLSLIHI